ncbi:hypothetical protein H0V99_01585 [Candidatus Saccharibacteria bacterium]|nr:hypothetical protein [Candidatus Saccharibacteria bacterium]
MNSESKFLIVETDPEDIMWLLVTGAPPRAYCKKHTVPLEIAYDIFEVTFCPVDKKEFSFTNEYSIQQRLVEHLGNREALSKLKFVRLDSEGSRVIARESVDLLEEWWIEAKASDTSSGVQLMVQIGKRNESGKKVQLFVDTPRQRLGFDFSDKDTHPAGKLAEVVVTFKDSVTIIKAKDN